MNESEPVALARRLGELEGAAFAAGLAARERTARAERLSRIALGGDEADLAAAGSASVAAATRSVGARIPAPRSSRSSTTRS